MGIWDKFFDRVEDAIEDVVDKLDDTAKDIANEYQKKVNGAGTAKKVTNYAKLAVHVEDAQAALKELDALADEILRLNTTAAACRDAFDDGWQGKSGDAMRDKVQAWIDEQAAIARELEGTRRQLNTFLNNLVNRDKELAKAIRNS